MEIRKEEEIDWFTVHSLNTEAFDTPAEALLVDALREQARPLVSFVAEVDGIVIGHIFFSPVTLAGRPELKLMALAPLAVDADFRRRGIGEALVKAGLLECAAIGAGAVVVVGDPKYYPKFGFESSDRFGLRSEFKEVPKEAFLIKELVPGYLDGASGVIKYHPAFSLV